MKKHHLLSFYYILFILNLFQTSLLISQDVFQLEDELCKNLPIDITYISLDYKVRFDQERNVQDLKVLEFQDGPAAGFRAYDNLFYKGKIWKDFWTILNKFNLPIWYIGPKPVITPQGIFSHNDKERVAFDYFCSIGGHYARHLEELETNPTFKKIIYKNTNKSDKSPKTIVLTKLCPSNMLIIEEFKKKFPQVIFVNNYSRYYTKNKEDENKLFDDQIKQFRPQTYIGKKEYHPDLATKIKEIITSDYLVIKPVNSSRSNGVIMVHKENLNKILKKILPKKLIPQMQKMYRPLNPLSIQYWKNDTHPRFIAEEYVQSNPMKIEDKEYDPTSRMVFALTNDKEKLSLHYLAGFWKIPKAHINEHCTLTKKHISTYTEKFAQLNKEEIAMSDDDKDTILKAFTPLMFHLYKKMLSKL